MMVVSSIMGRGLEAGPGDVEHEGMNVTDKVWAQNLRLKVGMMKISMPWKRFGWGC